MRRRRSSVATWPPSGTPPGPLGRTVLALLPLGVLAFVVVSYLYYSREPKQCSVTTGHSTRTPVGHSAPASLKVDGGSYIADFDGHLWRADVSLNGPLEPRT